MRNKKKLFIWIHWTRWTYVINEFEFSKKLTKEAKVFLQKKGIVCVELVPPDKWWGWEDIWQMIYEIFQITWIILKIFSWLKVLLKIFSYWWEKTKEVFEKDDSQFIIFLRFVSSEKDNDEMYWKRILKEMLDISLMLTEHFSNEYKFIKFWCAVRFSVFYENFRVTIRVAPTRINVKYFKKLKNRINGIFFKKTRNIDIVCSRRIIQTCSELHYEWNGSWSTEWKPFRYRFYNKIYDYWNKVFHKDNYF